MKYMAILVTLLFSVHAYAEVPHSRPPGPVDPKWYVLKLRMYLTPEPQKLPDDIESHYETFNITPDAGINKPCVTLYTRDMEDSQKMCGPLAAFLKFVPSYASMEPAGWVDIIVCPTWFLNDEKLNAICPGRT